MPARGRHRGPPARMVAPHALVLMVCGVTLLALPVAAAFTAAPAAGPAATQLGGPGRPLATVAVRSDVPSPPAAPRRLLIDGLALAADVEPVGLAGDGSLATPTDPSAVGWFEVSSVPGEIGPAVLVGHVDSADGPAVFAHLGDLRAGDLVTVERHGGAPVAFAVTSVETHPRDTFPTDAVYGGSPDAELRLITCGGDYVTGSGYTDNVVVTATAVG